MPQIAGILVAIFLSLPFAHAQESKPAANQPAPNQAAVKAPDTAPSVAKTTLPASPAASPAAEETIDPRLAKIFAGANPSGIADLRLMQDHVRKISEKLQKATVGVQVGAAQGSGVIINKEGYVLTAAHVSGQPKRQVLFQLYDGRKLFGETLGLDRSVDGGLMKITEGKDFPHLEMGDSSKLREGQWVLATGHPGGYQSDRKPVLRLGRLLLVERTVLTTDCTLVGGDSGGPLFDMEGKVIGINSRIATPLTANMHVPVNTFKDTWDRMVKAEAWGHFPGQEPFLGVRGEKDAKNAKLAHVFPDSPAEKAGLKVGDIVEAFDGEVITDFPSLSAQVQQQQPGDRIKLKVKRGEETLELKLVLGKRGE
ncbi:Periplasmic pH-dependent serine endoprotease DegQ precursor [Anatilimnocola aggregata]|uniref:Periplasmic pH-dependent serine endoprotease DegQ n=1 Tax=Anatilimnocola aggregata TaxID=2528021 RepID=A0A517YN34_9BACT|nr:trypsin-like peptidase domain-containing protein [Anatilimnocola aggregata]QDU31622.1 Periplasmic pH-dependent serine endoprotease DegQ precursor [Anatilimnocola aggregata]